MFWTRYPIFYVRFTDFMIRLAAIRTSAPRSARMTTQTFIPDGVEHLRFKQRRGRKGYYLACNKATYDLFSKSMSTYRTLSSLYEIIDAKHLLRRV